MEFPGGGTGAGGGAVLSGNNVPAFLTKLWTLVEDPDTDPLICWSPSGTSFHVFDQGRFSKEVLPKFFKHNNMASFIRQLNMYGFRKVVHIEHGGLVKPERDDTEFQHPFFIRGQEHLLENIKRKVTNVSSVRQEDMKMSADEVSKILTDVQLMKGKQEAIDSRIIAMKHENEALWREVASLRQKHFQQQKVVSKLIQFLVSLVQSNRILGVKRKIPLMLNDSSSAHSLPKYSRPFSLEHVQAAANLFSADTPLTSGPIISDITDVATPTVEDVVSEWTDVDAGENDLIGVKEEPSSPEVEACPVVDTPLSPTTFINSILQDNDPQQPANHQPASQQPANQQPANHQPASQQPAHQQPANQQPANQQPANQQPAPHNGRTGVSNPVVVMSSTSTGPSQSPGAVQTSNSAPSPCPSPSTQQKCQTIACIDRSELLDHVDSIDYSLENLQNVLNSQTFSFDTSPLIEFFGSSLPSGDFDLDSLDTLLSEEPPKPSDETNTTAITGKQLVQYTPVPPLEGGADLPSLLEPLFATDLAPDSDPTLTSDL
ncbi:heat shock factor protein 1 isoform X2 [Sphaeramia orbicularis]|uniref:Heat shock factor protein-like n=1 Tax=Sphaeramia orbicularis TaxID=375764 RepID=A0A672Z908_9TELE|nr:heat shock factor protein-like isoform X2 [Sphaeramia orbicularis]